MRRSVMAAIVALVMFVVTTIIIHTFLTEPYPGHNDFMSRWEGARSYFVEGLNPYGDQASLNIQRQIYGRPVVEGEDPGFFAYPFYTVFVVWPLVYLPYSWASAIWMTLLIACLIGGLLLAADLCRWKPSPPLLALLVMWSLLLYYPARGLILGQPGLLVYFLEMLALWGLVRQRDGLAGAALALSTLKPQMGFLIVPLLLLWGLWQRRWRFVGVFSVAMIGLLLISFLLLPTWLSDWLAQLGLYPSYTALGSPVWIITSYYLGLGGWAEVLIGAALVGVLLWGWYGVLIQRRSERFLWAAALALTVTHLIAPRTATPHYVVFTLPLLFYFAALARRDRRRGSLWVALIALALIVGTWLHFLTTVAGEFEHPAVYLPLPLAMLALLLVTRRWWWTRGAAI